MKLLLFVFPFIVSSFSIARAAFFAHGEYVSTNTKSWPVELKISKKGFIKSNFPMTIPQGPRVAISFPYPLYWNSETESFSTTGWFAVQMAGPGVSVVCQYPVRLDSAFYNGAYQADVSLIFAQRYFFKEGRCTQEGEAETFHIFRRVKD